MAAVQLALTVEEASDARDGVLAVLAAGRISSLVIVPRRRDERTLLAIVRAAQTSGCAALIENDAHLARKLGADGLHLGAADDVADLCQAARRQLGRDTIVGVDAGGSRHVAMCAGEAGSDYVAFARPLGEPGAQSQRDLVAWWADLFEVPCIALDVSGPAVARSMAEARADFLDVRWTPGMSIADLVGCVATIRAAVDAVPAAGA